MQVLLRFNREFRCFDLRIFDSNLIFQGENSMARHITTSASSTLAVLAIAAAAGTAHASCGTDFCLVNTHWDTQGNANDQGLTLDLRYSFARANQLRAGSRKIAPEAPSGADIEIEDQRTINRVLHAELDYAINARWNVALGVPLVARDHTHTFDSSLSGPFQQQVSFTRLGDMRVVGKYKLETDGTGTGAGIRFGLKLPTGATNQAMSPPDPAEPTTPYALERSSQPGTGSLDAIVGVYGFLAQPASSWSWFTSAQLQKAISTRNNYQPGQLTNIDVGLSYAFSPLLTGMLQLNAQHRARDTGSQANPASGGHSINLSPGLTYAVTPKTRFYGFLQKPLRQYANTDPAEPASGQLTAPWSLAMGINYQF
jgi:hypothetical protein